MKRGFESMTAGSLVGSVQAQPEHTYAVALPFIRPWGADYGAMLTISGSASFVGRSTTDAFGR